MGWGTTAAAWRSNLSPDLWERARDSEAPERFQDAYNDETWRIIFGQWLASEYATENLNFLEAADAFTGDAATARNIYNTYIRTNAPEQVNISADQRGLLDRAFAAGAPNLDADVFEEARQEIMKLLQSDNYRRFAHELSAMQADVTAAAAGPGRSRSGAIEEDDPYSRPDLPAQPPDLPSGEPGEDVDPHPDEDEGPLPPTPTYEEEPAMGVEAASWDQAGGWEGATEEPMTDAFAAELQEPVTADGALSFLADPEWDHASWDGTGTEQPAPDAWEADPSWGELEGAAGEPMTEDEQHAVWNSEDGEQEELRMLA